MMLFLNRHERMDAYRSLFNVYPRGPRMCVYSEERMSIKHSFLYESGRLFHVDLLSRRKFWMEKKKTESDHELSCCRSTQAAMIRWLCFITMGAPSRACYLRVAYPLSTSNTSSQLSRDIPPSPFLPPFDSTSPNGSTLLLLLPPPPPPSSSSSPTTTPTT